jgi:hypothetical protein
MVFSIKRSFMTSIPSLFRVSNPSIYGLSRTPAAFLAILLFFWVCSAPTWAAAPTILSGDLSHRWLKTAVESTAGKFTERWTFAERIRLRADGGTGEWKWRIGVSTLNFRCPSAALTPLGHGTENVLSFSDFQFVNIYAERALARGLNLRFGRTQVPFFRFKSELLWDNDIYWDGIFAEHPIRGLQKAKWHGGVFAIHRDLRFRGDRLYLFGAMGQPTFGRLKTEWRIDHFRYGFDNAVWKNNLAPSYRTLNLYGAVDFVQPIRLTLDLSRNFHADASGEPAKGGDGLNATLLLGRTPRNHTFQLITQYLKVGAHAAPPTFLSYEKRMNVSGFQHNIKFRLTKKTFASFCYIDWHRLSSAIPTDRRYRRWEIALDHSF